MDYFLITDFHPVRNK